MKKYFILFILPLIYSDAWAYRAIYGGEFGSQTPLVFTTWTGSSDAQINTSFCGQGSWYGPPFPRSTFWQIHENYNLRLTNTSNQNDGFSLRNGNNTLPFTLSNTHTISNQNQTLQHDQRGPYQKNNSDCVSGSISNRLRFSISQANLEQASSGTYTNRFLLKIGTGWGEGNNAFNSEAEKTVDISITVADLIRLSDLNDFVFGTQSGSTDLTQTDSVCVYRNSSGSYQVTASGDGTNGAFTINNGIHSIPFTPQWSDGGAFQTLAPNAPLINQQNVFQSNIDCNSGTANNANLKIGIASSDMQSAPSGNYQGVLNIMVSAQ